MERARVWRSLTLDEDPTAFASPRCFIAAEDGSLWWHLAYVHAILQRNGAITWKRAAWLTTVITALDSSMLPPGQAKRPPGHRVAGYTPTVVTTMGLLWILGWLVVKARGSVQASLCLGFLAELCSRVAILRVVVDLGPFRYESHSIVGFVAHLERGLGALAFASMERAWAGLLAGGYISTPFSADRHPFADVVVFLLLAVKFLRSVRRWPAASTSTFLANALVTCFDHLATHITVYIRDVYCRAHDTSRPPPPMSCRKPNTRKYVVLDIEAKWEIIEQAATTGQSIEQVMRIKSGDPRFGGSYKSVATWLPKLNHLFFF